MSSLFPKVLALCLCVTGAFAQSSSSIVNRGEEVPKIAIPDLAIEGRSPQRETSARGQAYIKDQSKIAEGQRLFKQMNCVGCHSRGGGGMGPALMDDKWIYGGQVENIAASIREGRPNGMPSWRGKIAEDDIWKLAAYVHALSSQGSPQNKQVQQDP